MGLKDIAVATATEADRHRQEQARITAQQQVEAFERRARKLCVDVLGAEPEELIVSPRFGSIDAVNVRIEDMWFTIGKANHYTSYPSKDRDDVLVFLPAVRCVDNPAEFHRLYVTMGLAYSGFTTLEELGQILRIYPPERWRKLVNDTFSKCSCKESASA